MSPNPLRKISSDMVALFGLGEVPECARDSNASSVISPETPQKTGNDHPRPPVIGRREYSLSQHQAPLQELF